MATESRHNATFPGPDQRPQGYVIIFDGKCRFCRANMRWLAAVDCARVAYLSLHDPEVARRWPELSHEQLMRQIYLVDKEGRMHAGAAAFRFLSRKLPALWPLAPLLHIPGSLPLWQFVYKQIARIRYRFGRVEECDSGSCGLHFD